MNKSITIVIDDGSSQTDVVLLDVLLAPIII
jgi:hypothetical protein